LSVYREVSVYVWADSVVCYLSSSVTFHGGPAGGFIHTGQAMTTCRLQSDYSSTVSLHVGSVVLRPVTPTPRFLWYSCVIARIVCIREVSVYVWADSGANELLRWLSVTALWHRFHEHRCTLYKGKCRPHSVSDFITLLSAEFVVETCSDKSLIIIIIPDVKVYSSSWPAR